jgi:hypothetical protein
VENPLGRDVLHIRITAGLAIVLLIGAGIWQIARSWEQRTAAGTFVAASEDRGGAQDAAVAAADTVNATNTDPISAVSDDAVGELVGAFAGLQQQGIYSTSTAQEVGGSIGLGLQTPITYAPIGAADVKTSPDTSYAAMMKYRAALQTSLKPLLRNTTPEYELFGEYVETKQTSYLDQMHAAALNYAAAASSTLALTVPADGVQVQIELVNSLNEFAATLDAMETHADDPIAGSVLLENYNTAENDVLNAFQALVTYEQSKNQ